MAVTAQEVITAARDLHEAFTQTRTPNGILLRQLTHFKRRLTHAVTNVNPDVLAVSETIDLSTYNFSTGYAFPAHVYVLPSGEAESVNEIDPGDRARVTILGMTNRRNTRPLRSGWFIQNQFYLNGTAQDWTGYVNVFLDYVAIPTGPAALTENFDPFPDTVFDVLVQFAANVMAKRGHNDPTLPQIDRAQFEKDATTAWTQFLAEMGERRKARRIKTLDVFPGG